MTDPDRWRADLTPKVAEAIWENHYDRGTFTWGDIDGTLRDRYQRCAAAAIDTVLAAFHPPF